jgi:hypothetical protein
MSKRSKRGKKKPQRKPKSELSKVKPITGKNFGPEQLKEQSNKKLLVTALALSKKSKNKRYPKKQRESMRVVAAYITQLLQERMALPAGV